MLRSFSWMFLNGNSLTIGWGGSQYWVKNGHKKWKITTVKC